MKNKKIISKKEKIVKFAVFILGIFTISIFIVFATNNNENKNNESMSSMLTGTSALSTEKIGWGIKRNGDNKQPEVGKKYEAVLKENEGIWLGNSEKPYIYLTFDEGYEAGYTEQILQTLKDNNVTATFFITAHYLNSAEDIVAKMIENGNIVGNHTVNHKSMPGLSEQEIKAEVMDLHQAVYEKFGYEMKYIRPPKGEFSAKSISITNSYGYKTAMWSFAYEDWEEKKQPSEESAKEKILNNLHNGEIMLLHATSKTNAKILDDIIKQAKEKGYEFKSLDEFEM